MSARLCCATFAFAMSSVWGADLVNRVSQPEPVHSLLSQGRHHWAHFNGHDALQSFSAAFASLPDNPGVLIEYAAATPDRALEAALLTRLLRTGLGPDHRLDAERRLSMLARLGDRPVHHLASPYTSYEIRMPVAYAHEGRAAGWVVTVRVNEGRPLRLLLDTGSRGILISPGAARKLELEYLGESTLRGFGDSGVKRGEYRLAANLSAGDLTYRNVILETGGCELPADLDGLAGVDLFRHFQITLDGPKKVLRLEPFDTDPGAGDGERPWTASPGLGGHTLTRAGHLLIAQARLRSGDDGRFIIDSGAAYSLLHLREPALAMRNVSLQGLSGFVAAAEIMQPVRFQIGEYRATLREALAVDLSPVSERVGDRIDGFIGFPLLRRLTATIDLRSGHLQMR